MLRLGIITALGGAAGAIVLLLSPTADGGNRLGQGVALLAVAMYVGYFGVAVA